jgi:transposase
MDQATAIDSLHAGTLPDHADSGNFVVGIDVADRVFQVHAAAPGGKVARLRLKRAEVVEFVEQLPGSSVIAMEACSSAHHWARVFRDLGHEARLIPVQHVKPFVLTNKSDRADALAIWEAAQRPGIYFVRVKTREEQAVMLLHSHRSYLVSQRIKATNRLRAAFREFGIVFDGSWRASVKSATSVLKEAPLPAVAKDIIAKLLSQVAALEDSIVDVERRLRFWAASDELSKRYLSIPGVGLITATAVATTVGDGSSFASGRNFSAAIGLIPSHSGTGGVTRIGRLSRRGNRYLKRLLIQAALMRIINRRAGEDPWLDALLVRKRNLVAAIAVANKLARVMWAMATRGLAYSEEVWRRPNAPPPKSTHPS